MRRLYFLIAFAALLSCSRENSGNEFIIEAEAEDLPKSRLITTEAGLSKVTELCCFVYDSESGMLETVGYKKADKLSLPLKRSVAHKAFLFANLGDLRATAPILMSEMTDYSCPVPSFAGMSANGLPMCSVETVPAWTSLKRFTLRRLMARFYLHVSSDELVLGDGPLTPNNIYVRQSATVFYPFSPEGSAVRSPEQVSDAGGDRELLLFSGFDNIQLFIPENCQGNLLEVGALQMEKSLSNPELESVKGAMCTFIEVSANKNNNGDGVSGDLVYRFFPGNGQARNFDICGGYSYDIDLKLSWNGMFVEGNWKVERSSWMDERSLQVSASPDGPYEQNIFFQLPPGAAGCLHYLCFSPFSDGTHSRDGWSMIARGGISANILSQGDYYATVSVSVDMGTRIGSQETVRYETPEGRHRATVHINVVEPQINLDRNEVVCSDSDTGEFSVRVASSNVPLGQISVISSWSELQLLSYDSTTGTARARWKYANSGSTRRSATLVFSGLGASAVCTVYQLSPSSFSIEEELSSGNDNQTF